MKECLIIVDYQNDFVDGKLGFKGAEKLEPLIIGKIEKAIRNHTDFYFTKDTHHEDYLLTEEGQKLPVPHCLEGTFGHDLYGGLKAYERLAAGIFLKPTFASLELGLALRKQNYDHVELCGLVTHICVISNAVMAKAALPDAKIVIDRNLVASYDPILHQKSLEVMQGFQIDIEG